MLALAGWLALQATGLTLDEERNARVYKHRLERSLSYNHYNDWASTLADRGSLSEFPFYHTVDGSANALQQLATAGNMQYEHLGQPANQMPMLTTLPTAHLDMERKPKGQKKKKRVFIVGGEHAREVMGSEVVLRLAEMLAEKNVEGEDLERVRRLKKVADFSIIPIVNTAGRSRVDVGSFCKRTNQHGVDLNRNWEAHWREDTNTGSGPSPFSEPESKSMSEYAEKLHPDFFLCVHTGQKALFMPHAYTTQPPKSQTAHNMEKVLRATNEKYHLVREAKLGAAGEKLGYTGNGMSLDWMYDSSSVQAPYSLAFEVYTNTIEDAQTSDSSSDADLEAARHADTQAWMTDRRQSRALRALQKKANLERRVGEGEDQDQDKPAIPDEEHSKDFCRERWVGPSSEESYKKIKEKWSQAALFSMECALLDKCS